MANAWPTVGTSDPSAVETVSAFLRAASDPASGGALYDHYADGASLYFGARLVSKGEVDRAAFAEAHASRFAAFAAARPDVGAPPAFTGLRLVSWAEEAPGQVIAWFEVEEAQTARPFAMAVGLRREGEPWRLDWLTLAEAVREWSFVTGRAQSMADFSFGVEHWPAPPRSALDVAHFRLAGAGRPAVRVLPKARFSCQGSGTCCRQVFDIALPATAQGFIDAMPWETIAPELVGTQLEERPDGTLQLKHKGEACRFLSEAAECLIHKHMGRAVFAPCAIYPLQFAETPEGVDVALNYRCDSARYQFGPLLTDRLDDIESRAVHGTPLRTDAYHIAPDQVVDWETFRDAELAIVEALGRRDLPLLRRLWMGARALEARLEGRAEADPGWETEPLEALGEAQRMLIMQFVIQLPMNQHPQLAALLTTPMPAFQPESRLSVGWLSEYLQNVIHGKLYSYSFSLASALNIAIVLYLLARQIEACFPDGNVPAELWSELAGFGWNGGAAIFLTHAGASQNAFFSSPGFGQWMLRYALDEPTA